MKFRSHPPVEYTMWLLPASTSAFTFCNEMKTVAMLSVIGKELRKSAQKHYQHIHVMYTCQKHQCQRELSCTCIGIKRIEKSILMNRLAFPCLLTKGAFVWTTRKVVVKSDKSNTKLFKVQSLSVSFSLYCYFLDLSFT